MRGVVCVSKDFHFFFKSGTYKASESTQLCSACSPGMYNLKLGSTNCSVCPVGQYCPVSALPATLNLFPKQDSGKGQVIQDQGGQCCNGFVSTGQKLIFPKPLGNCSSPEGKVSRYQGLCFPHVFLAVHAGCGILVEAGCLT